MMNSAKSGATYQYGNAAPGFCWRSTRATPLEFSRSLLRNSCHRDRLGARLDRRCTVQIRLDRGGAGAEPCAVDLQILHDPLDVVARLGERDALDPVDGIDLGIAWIAVLRHPLLDPAAAGVVARKSHDVGAAVVRKQPRELGRPHLGVVG